MKIRSKYLMFISFIIVCSLGIFLIIALNAYSSDKVSFIKEKATQDTLSLAGKISELIRDKGDQVLLTEEVKKLFLREDIADRYLVDKHGIVTYGNEALVGKSFATDVSLNALSRINKTPFASGLIEAQDNKGNQILVSFTSVPESNHIVLQVYKLSQLNRFLILFIIKTIFSFLAIGSFFLLTGYFVVNNLSQGLEVLSSSVEQYSQGNYKHRVDVDLSSKDEVTTLGLHINNMADKIQKNLKLEEEKARLKTEMETAQKVQETLFLPNSFKNKNVEITGFYEPASECGGDWWYYFERGSSTWICIGDVTGHGVGAAMLTSSVRAAFTFFQQENELRPSQILTQLNKVIWESVGGRMNMTFFVMEIDRENKKMRYSNASHEYPLLIPKCKDVKKKDVSLLLEVNGPRMGQKVDSQYVDYEMDIQSGSRIICFSDGLYDVQNNKGESYGDARLVRHITKINSGSKDTSAFVRNLMADILQHRQVSPLVDDVSLMCIDIDFT